MTLTVLKSGKTINQSINHVTTFEKYIFWISESSLYACNFIGLWYIHLSVVLYTIVAKFIVEVFSFIHLSSIKWL